MGLSLPVILLASAVSVSEGAPPQQTPELLEQVRQIGNQGATLYAAGRLAEAIPFLERAAEAFWHLGATTDELDTTLVLGHGYLELGDHQAAIVTLQRGLELAQALDSATDEIAARLFLADALTALGRRSEELEHVAAALTTVRAVGQVELIAPLLARLGTVEWRLGWLDQAAEHLEEALLLVGRTDNAARDRAKIQQNLGVVLTSLGRLREAEILLRQVMDYARRTDYQEGEAAALNSLGLVHYKRGQNETAILHYRRAEALFERLGDESSVGMARLNIADVLAAAGRNDEAGAVYEEGIETAHRVGDLDLLVTALSRAADQAQAQGRYPEAKKRRLEELDLRRRLGDPGAEASVLAEISWIEHLAGRRESALQLVEESLSLWRVAGNAPGEVLTLYVSGFLYIELGRFEEGLNRYEAAIDRAHEVGDPRVGALVGKIAEMLLSIGQPEEALLRADEAVAMAVERHDLKSELSAVKMRALVLAMLNRWEPAQEDVARGLELCRLLDDSLSASQLLMTRGFIAGLDGYMEGARQALEATVAAHREIFATDGPRAALAGLAQIHRRRGDRAAAIDWTRRAVAAFERSLGEVTNDLLVSSFAPTAGELYTRLVLDLVVEGEPEEAFEVAEAARARGLLVALGGGPGTGPVESSGTDPAAAREARELSERLRLLRREIDLIRRAAPGGSEAADLVRLLGRQDETQRQFETVLVRLSRTDPEAASLLGPTPVTLEQVQAHLEPGTTLVSYFVTGAGTLGWVVTRERHRLVRLAPATRDLEAAVIELRHAIALGEAGPAAGRLYVDLVEPVRRYIETDRVLVVPHGVLHLVPFAALRDPESGRYLVEDFTLAVLPSASVLPWLKAKEGGSGGKALVLGDPDGSLPGAAEEARAAAALFGEEALIGPAATETALRTRAPGSDVIHVAAHTVLDSARPLFSRIELAEDVHHDGVLEIHEVFQLDLSETDLVVLSGCETGLGALHPGDDLTGLSRAFFRAGTPAVVASLWRVEDESTRRLFELFYRYLDEGQAPAGALREAQLGLLREGRWAAPLHWAGFALYGAGWP